MTTPDLLTYLSGNEEFKILHDCMNKFINLANYNKLNSQEMVDVFAKYLKANPGKVIDNILIASEEFWKIPNLKYYFTIMNDTPRITTINEIILAWINKPGMGKFNGMNVFSMLNTYSDEQIQHINQHIKNGYPNTSGDMVIAIAKTVAPEDVKCINDNSFNQLSRQTRGILSMTLKFISLSNSRKSLRMLWPKMSVFLEKYTLWKVGLSTNKMIQRLVFLNLLSKL